MLNSTARRSNINTSSITQRGGKLYGVGKAGQVIDVCTPIMSLCAAVKKWIDDYEDSKHKDSKHKDSICLYILTHNHKLQTMILHTVEEANTLLQMLQTKSSHKTNTLFVAKEFTNKSKANIKFHEELSIYLKWPQSVIKANIVTKFGIPIMLNNNARATAASSLVGVVINQNNSKQYFIIKETCTKTLHILWLHHSLIDAEFVKLTTHILEFLCSVQHLRGESCDDVKPDNIMRCGDRYKVVDFNHFNVKHVSATNMSRIYNPLHMLFILGAKAGFALLLSLLSTYYVKRFGGDTNNTNADSTYLREAFSYYALKFTGKNTLAERRNVYYNLRHLTGTFELGAMLHSILQNNKHVQRSHRYQQYVAFVSTLYKTIPTDAFEQWKYVCSL